MKDWVPEADGVKLLRDGGSGSPPLNPNSGGKPRPIRKKGFWRAHRRKELWLIHGPVCQQYNYFTADWLKQFAKVVYSPYVQIDTAYLTWPIKE